ncbi:ABC transporter transmembrane domain-containing protein [Sphingomonas sp. BIUV-7]|uniref:ABC transporter transmembrane domain-containing protein n=1 Tax=Sphingomonas natans TaxID=3063330 RepID=A0ABT8YDC5_9SPHN|nr:ABC transporter transmembrane domain-containing protein [Sphingomonas sp. BIUV-7]MDO6416347.1 ABC transporter transmembrane domain-containing protein [Sphingomonas sp. BIUV-7]
MASSLDTAPDKRRLGELGLIWRIAARYPGRIAGALAALIVSSAATLGIPYGFKRVIDRGFVGSGGSPAHVATSFHYLLMIVGVLAIATALRFYYVSWLGERVIADVRREVQANLLTLSPRFFEENRPSEIASRLTADTALIEQVVGSSVSIALRNIFIGLGGIAYMFILSPKLAALLLLAIPVAVVPIVMFGRRVRAHSRTSQDRVADIGATVAEVVGAMKIVQGFNQESRERRRFADVVERAFAASRTRIVIRAIMTAIVIGLIFGAVTLVLQQGAVDVARGRMTGGSIFAFVVVAGLVAGAFGALTETYGDLLRGAGAAARLGELLTEKAEIAAPLKPQALPLPPRGGLSFDHVEFRYPTRLEVAALHDFSLNIEPGETVAIVGPSGAGKSTLFQLAQRFYDPMAGTVRIDGVALTQVNPADVRARIAIVPQDTVIFAASARDNLRYGKWDADDAAIWAAAESANAAKFLSDLPQGLDTFMGEGGARLSGGQRQRLAIARAVLRDAPILLLDEATSALDAESERLVQRALERLMKGRTTIVIAHRLATVRMADRIVVMDQGRIVEEGKHDALVARGGLYARLAKLQFDSEVA